ncbi:MAG: hypothetical protein OEU54_02090 [Gemmatimonadota bacterium]|nr:hypothetical protein [Gemmatimonadota bacterium]
MFRSLASLFCAGLLGLSPAVAGAGAAQELDLTGAWEFAVQSPNGAGTREVQLVQVGDSISGTISSSRATGDLDGVLEGDRLSFTVVLTMESGPFVVTYRATVTGDEMVGTIDFGDYGSGTFTGLRSKAKLTPAFGSRLQRVPAPKTFST